MSEGSPMPAPVDIVAGRELNQDNEKRIESENKRKQVLEAFSSTFEMMSKDDSLTDSQKKDLEATKKIKEKTLDIGKTRYKNVFKDPDTNEEFSQFEGVPVEGLIEYLQGKASDPNLDEEAKKQYENKIRLLLQNSRNYYPMPSKDKPGSRTDPAVMKARIYQEYQSIKDESRSSGDNREDWELAADTLMRRRELVVPALKKEKKQNQEEHANIEKPPPPNDSGEDNPEQYEFTVVNRSRDVRYRARDLAEKMLRYKMREGSNWNPMSWLRRIKYHTAEEYFRQSWTQRIEKSMLENNNSALEWDLAKVALKNADANRTEEAAAGTAAVERIKEGELIAGEAKKKLDGEVKDRFVAKVIKPLLSSDSSKDAAWVQEQLRGFVAENKDDPVVSSIFGKDDSGRIADYFASDIVELGNKIREDLSAHKIALEGLDTLININIANSRWAAETDFEKSRADKVVAWTQDKLRGWLNPGTVGALFSAGTFFAMRAPSSALRALDFAAPGVGALAGGLIAGVRRSYEVKLDRRTHMRERAYGDEIPEKGAPRREAMEEYSYESASVAELRDGSGSDIVLGLDKRKGVAELTGLPADERKRDVNRAQIISRAAEIRSRLDLSASRHVDLVTFEGALKTEHGRLELLRSVCDLKKSLLEAGVSEEEYRRELADYESKWADKLTGSIDEKDKNFKRYKLKQSIYSSIQGAGYGFIAGLAVQELTALASRGLGIEAGSGPTIPEKILDRFLGTDLAPKPTGAEYLIGELVKNGKADLAHVSLRVDGSNVVIDQLNGKSYSGIMPEISLDPSTNSLVIKGDITDARFGDLDDAFRNSGLGMYVENSALPSAKTIDAKDFLAQTKGSVDHFEWYGNNTLPSDMRELEMHNWKTDNGTGVTFSMAQMGKDAFQSGNTPYSVDVPQFVKEGKGVFTFWNPGDINNPVIIKADAQGLLTLDKAASAGETVEVFRNGKWEAVSERSLANLLLGKLDNFQKDSDYTRHFEILNSKCSAGGLFEKNGKTHFGSFATIKGTGSMPDSVPGFGPDVKTILTPPDPMKTAPPIAIPFAPRKPLEEMSKNEQANSQDRGVADRQNDQGGSSNNNNENRGGGQSGSGSGEQAGSNAQTGSPDIANAGRSNSVLAGEANALVNKPDTSGEFTGDVGAAGSAGSEPIREGVVEPIGQVDSGAPVADAGNNGLSTANENQAASTDAGTGVNQDVGADEKAAGNQGESFVDRLFNAGNSRVGDSFIRVDSDKLRVSQYNDTNNAPEIVIGLDRANKILNVPEGDPAILKPVIDQFANAGYRVN